MRAALCVRSWMGLALIGWAFFAHVRERVVLAAPALLTKRPAPVEPPRARKPALRDPPVWN
jgi:hypothetical protein